MNIRSSFFALLRSAAASVAGGLMTVAVLAGGLAGVGLFSAGLASVSGCTRQTSAPTSDSSSAALGLIRPRSLRPGDKVAIVAPSYAKPDSTIAGAEAVLREWGYVPVLGPNVRKEYAGAYAGTAAERASDLRWALSDPSIAAVLTIGGGYGTVQLLPLMSEEDFRAHPKWIIGFSDITVLHAMANAAGVQSLHATVGGFLAMFRGQDPSSLALRDFLAGEPCERVWPLGDGTGDAAPGSTAPGLVVKQDGRSLTYAWPAQAGNRCGEASGTLVGGNLISFATLGESWADPLKYVEGDLILFIEETEETWHAIDRMVCLLLQTGKLSRVKGIILGQFTDCTQDLDYPSIESMLMEEYFSALGRLPGADGTPGYVVPVACGFPAGHEFQNNFPLPLGAHARLTVTPDGCSLVLD